MESDFSVHTLGLLLSIIKGAVQYLVPRKFAVKYSYCGYYD